MRDRPLAGTLVVCDMDNTLLCESAGLPAENQQAIRRFCALGGSFTVATGRNVPAIRPWVEKLGINAPAILLGGGLIYDYSRELALNVHYLPLPAARQSLLGLMDAFPALSFEVTGEDMQVYVVRAGEGTEHHLRAEHFDAVWADAQRLSGRWMKALAAGDAAACRAAARLCAKHGAQEGIRYQRTQDCYFELLPAQTDKGTALRSLCRILGIPWQNSCAVGDYYNDVALLRAAGFAVAVANAVAPVRRCADLVVGRCEEGGVAQFLQALIRQRLGGRE